MRFIASLALVAVSLAVVLASSSDVIDSSNVASALYYRSLFDAFKTNFAKQYESQELEAYRYNIFVNNVMKIDQLNEAQGHEVFGVNQFTDLDTNEFARTHLGYIPKTGQAAIDRLNWKVTEPDMMEPMAASVDWRTKGAVTAVKDQGQCGSCWAFSATEQIESAYFLAGNTIPTLAPQQTVSCDTTDAGCNGGDTPTAYAYAKKNGIEGEKDYPYVSGTTGQTGTCKFSASKVEVKITNFTYAVTPCYDSCAKQDETTLAANVAQNGPASICVNAAVWQLYSSGVLTSGCTGAYSDLDHCVQLVGYGSDSTYGNYWLVRNSWGPSWGEAGYIRVARGNNLCGVADEATFVQI